MDSPTDTMRGFQMTFARAELGRKQPARPGGDQGKCVQGVNFMSLFLLS